MTIGKSEVAIDVTVFKIAGKECIPRPCRSFKELHVPVTAYVPTYHVEHCMSVFAVTLLYLFWRTKDRECRFTTCTRNIPAYLPRPRRPILRPKRCALIQAMRRILTARRNQLKVRYPAAHAERVLSLRKTLDRASPGLAATRNPANVDFNGILLLSGTSASSA